MLSPGTNHFEVLPNKMDPIYINLTRDRHFFQSFLEYPETLRDGKHVNVNKSFLFTLLTVHRFDVIGLKFSISSYHNTALLLIV